MFECPRCKTQYKDPPAFCGVCGSSVPDTQPMIAPHGDPLVGMVVDGRYRIIDLIGRGGMGAVYRVEHVKMGKIMAMKLLHGELSSDSDMSRRFKREAETVSRLSHINTVSVFDFGSYNSMMYLVMEYIDGSDLSEQVRAEGRIPFNRVANILIQVCSALIEAHSKGIIHRDLKPENIIVGHRDERVDFVKVLDFGLAKLRDMGDKTRITVKGSLVGTPYYMAPEHIRGEAVDQRSDIYALGAVMFKLLTGETPFTANTPMGIISKHLTEELESPTARFPDYDIPAVADEIVLRAMSKDANDRFQSAEEMREALSKATKKVSSLMPSKPSSPDLDASWKMGSKVVKPTNGWEVGDSESTSQSLEQTSDSPGPSDLGETVNLNKSIIIGAREVGISTKSDFIKFEQRLRRKRIFSAIFGVLCFLAVVLGVAFYIFRDRFDDSNPSAETEPNGDSTHADTMRANVSLRGYISGSDPQGDKDWYRLRGFDSSPTAYEVTITGVEGLDLALQLLVPGTDKPVATANRVGQGGSERIGPTILDTSDVYLIVQEIRAPGIPAGNFSKTPYQLIYRVMNPAHVEREPNNAISAATPALIGATLSGDLGPGDTMDYFCVAAGIAVKTIQVTGIAGTDIKLTLRLGPLASAIPVDNSPFGQGEGVSVPAGPGPTCVQVEMKQPVTAGGSYRILFR